MAYTSIDNPELYFQTKIYTGDGNDDRDIVFDVTDTTMQPDFLWSARRDSGDNLSIYDSVRGDGKELRTAETGAEYDRTNNIQSLNSNGFQVGDDGQVNASGGTYVSWAWKAGGSASSNSNGTITSTVSANQTSGFSIVTYSGNSTAGATVGHGLSVVPSVVLVKSRDGTYGYGMYHHKNTSAPETDYLSINNTDATVDDVNFWNDTAPTSSVFSLGGTDAINKTSNSHVAYVFAEKKGYSKFGSYTGNGNADGTFVYIGFKPAWVMIKESSNAGNAWHIRDNKRSTFNVVNDSMYANSSIAEVTNNSSLDTDFLSNGFKLRNSDTNDNGSGRTYIYMAFAEAPFVSSSGVPTTAR